MGIAPKSPIVRLVYKQEPLYSDIKGLEPPSTSINALRRLQRESVGGQYHIKFNNISVWKISFKVKCFKNKF